MDNGHKSARASTSENEARMRALEEKVGGHGSAISVLQERMKHLATKEGLADVRTEIADLRGGLQKDIADTSGGLQKDIADLRGELQKDIADLRGGLQKEIADLGAKMTSLISALETRFMRFLYLQTFSLVIVLATALFAR